MWIKGTSPESVSRIMMGYVYCRISDDSARAHEVPWQPITDVTSNDVICNGGINPYHQPISKSIINVPAGSPVTAEFHHSKIS